MPISGMKPPMTNFGTPSAGAMRGMSNAPGGYGGGGQIAPPPPAAMPNIGAPQTPMALGVDPTKMGLPPGAVLYDDGSVRLPAQIVGQWFGANQSGGANPVPPGLPPNFGSPGGMFGGPPPPGMTPPPGPPALSAQMPGQPPPMPTDPASLAMAGPPPGMEPPPNLSVPGGASIRDGMPMAADLPKPDYEQADKAGGEKKTPASRLADRGKKPMPKGGKKG